MKILLIDDSALSRTLLKRALGGEYTYVDAAEGMAGMETYFLEKPDLVILDLTMPGVNGLEVLTRLRELDPEAKIIIGSADVQEYSRQQAMELGALGFINKPFSPEEVQAAVRKALEVANE
jgi:two-component system chemotaxis response regulator CheY